jgi:glycosyltransferase involved in cell wall biosynthesis
VVTIHDFTYQLFPDSHHRLYGLGLRLLIGAGVRRSHRVIACSQHTAGDAQRLLGVAPGEIDVVPWGLGARAVAAPTPEAELRARLALADRRVLLALSDKRPHKNLVRLVQALARLPAQGRPALVIAGYSTPYERELRRRIAELELEDDVRVCDWVSDGDREGLYALASAFVFPSLYEGFGLPVLEAMARGLPVASSNAASLPELTGDAALSFDPRDVDAIAAALARVLDDGALVARLRAAGPARAARFTWQRAAELTLASYERALG